MIDYEELLFIFANIVFEALPFIIIGALISGVMEELLPQQAVTKIIPKNRVLAVGGSALLGLIFPMCECGIVPVMRRLLGKGLPLACAVAYMLAAPIINVVVIGSTYAAFYNPAGSREDGLSSMQMVGLRVGMAFVVAFTVGLIVHWLERRRGAADLLQPIRTSRTFVVPPTGGTATSKAEDTNAAGHEPQAAAASGEAAIEYENEAETDAEEHRVHDAAAAPELQRKSMWRRISSICEIALHDFVDITCFLVIGAFLAALVQSSEAMRPFMLYAAHDFISVPLMMLLAVVLCLCSEADAFVAANLIKVPLSGKIAFLVLGPMLDIKLFFMYTRVFRFRLIWTIVGSVVVLVFLLSMGVALVDQVFSSAGN